MAHCVRTLKTPENSVITLQVITVVWMFIEAFASLFAAWTSRSVSLLAFGSDSLVELASAAIVLLQYTPSFRLSPARAAELCGLLLYGLAGLVSSIALAALFHRSVADVSRLGIMISAIALVLMPVLAWKKRAAARSTGNVALRADSLQSATCAYLAALTLTGLLLRSRFGLFWVDQIAALLGTPVLLLEARHARKGNFCSCC